MELRNIVELDLSDSEMEKLKESAEGVKATNRLLE